MRKLTIETMPGFVAVADESGPVARFNTESDARLFVAAEAMREALVEAEIYLAERFQGRRTVTGDKIRSALALAGEDARPKARGS